jgi:lambda family phage portal protein
MKLATNKNYIKPTLIEKTRNVVASFFSVFQGWTGSPSWGWFGQKSRGALKTTQPILVNQIELRRQSRKSYLESTEMRSMVSRLSQLTVADGLKLEATPVFDLVAPTWNKEKRRDFNKILEQRFKLYAESTEPDSANRMSFYAIQRMAKIQKLIDGEYFIILQYKSDSTRMSPLCCQFLRPEQVVNPNNTQDLEALKTSGNRVCDGIELDSYGEMIAIHVLDPAIGITKRIPVYDKNTKRRLVIHGANIETPGQIRGITPFVSFLHNLSKLTSIEVAELQAALVNATIAAFIKPSADAPASKVFKGIKRTSGQPTDEHVLQAPAQAELNDSGLFIQNLRAGEDITSYDTKRPNLNTVEYKNMLLESMSASIGVANSLVRMVFDASYSASRGEIILSWVGVNVSRDALNTELNDIIYKAWFTEEVKALRISAPNFNVPVYRQAWLKCNWKGIPLLDIDPLKSVAAAKERIAIGISTRKSEASTINGSEFWENVEELQDENPALAEANMSLKVDPNVNQPLIESDENEVNASSKRKNSRNRKKINDNLLLFDNIKHKAV